MATGDSMSLTIKKLIPRLTIVIIFSIAFAYIESAVVVYLREIFYPDGFIFPLKVFGIEEFGKKLLITEIGREAATLVLILTSCALFGYNRRQRFAYFLVIFAIWDIFYYVWLKVLLNWPASIMDWDILFLIPATWASPVLAPVLVSAIMFTFAVVILLLDAHDIGLKPRIFDWIGFAGTAVLIIAMFCQAGIHIEREDYYCHFNWPVFTIALLAAVAIFTTITCKALKAGQISKPNKA
jgi:hypothetical protein